MKTPRRSVVVALGAFFAGLLLIPPVYLASAALLEQIDKAALERRIAMLEETTITSPSDLQARYRSVQTFLLPISPPAPDCGVGCEEGIVVFNPKEFEGWTDALEPEERYGVTVYPVIVAEDPDTRETLFLNSSGKEIASIAPEKDYDPYACFTAWWPELLLETADPAKQAWHMAVCDPARISATYYLLSIEDVPAMAEAQLAANMEAAEERASQPAMRMMMGEGMPASVSNLVIFAIQQVTNGIALGIGWQDDFTNKLEVFASSNLAIPTGWFVLSSNLTTTGTNSLWWVDSSRLTSSVPVRFYRACDADQDSDADGLTDARERLIWGTGETNIDTDCDGLVDGYSGVVATNAYPGGAHTNGGVYVEGEMTWETDFLVFDTDVDGMGDGWEVANGHDPLDPNDPPNVSGTITYESIQTGAIRVVAVTNSESWSTNLCAVLTVPGAYRIANLPAANYWIKSWRDSDEDGVVDDPEASGVLSAYAVLVTNRLTGQDITLADPDNDSDNLPDWWEISEFGSITNWSGTSDPDGDDYTNQEEWEAGTDPLNALSHPWNISGAIAYTGPQTGAIYVVACTSASAWAAAQYTTLSATGAYTITHLPPDVDYWVRAWRDTETNATPAYWEAWGEHQDNPITLTTNLTAIDVAMTDPDSDDDTLPDWWEIQYGYNPLQGGGSDAAAWWKLDATSGTNVLDSASHTNHGVLVNGGAWASGVISNAVVLDGVDDYVEIPDSDSLKPNHVSVALWIKPAIDYTNGTAMFFSKKQSGDATGYRLSYEQGALSFMVCASGEKAISLPCNLSSGVWQHVVGTYGGENQRLYVDGVLAAQTNYNWSMSFGYIDQGTNSARLGASPGDTPSNCFAGVIDDVRVYAGELTSNKVWAIYEPGSDGDGDGLSAWQEYQFGTSPTNADTDADGLPDGWEYWNGVSDPNADPDNDGLTNLEEYQAGTNPNDNDTDDDGMNDGFEIVNELDPFTDDGMDNPDGDGFVNAEEALKGTDPQSATGGGGVSVRFYYDLDDRLTGAYFATNGAVQYEYGDSGNIGRIQERRAP